MHQIIRNMLSKIQFLDAVVPLALRIYLAPVLMQAGYNKLSHFESTVAWFGNVEWGLGLPLPALMAALAAGTEFVGAILLLLGLAVRLVCIPLMITMLVAAFSVHWQNGWLAIADASSWLASDKVAEASEKLSRAKGILKEYGNYEWLTSSGNFVILNNGIEFAMTYFLMLSVLFVYGAGRYTSIDYYISRRVLG